VKRRHLIMVWRVFINGGINFVRNAWLSIAAMAIMVVTLSILLFSFIANATFSHTIEEIRNKIDISVFLLDTVTDEQRENLISQLRSIENVRDIEYVSKEQALKDYIALNSDNVDLQLAITQTDNPLPATLRVKLKNPDRIEEVKAFLDKPEILALQSDKTSYSGDRKEAIDKIAKATTFIRQAGFIGVIVFACISVLIIFNTIQMAIFNRRDELSIMRLLGASRWYIRGPFLVESLLIGIAAALVSVGLCNIVFSVASGTLGATSLGLLDINYSSEYFETKYWTILATQLAAGIIIGVVSSFIATQRYLRLRNTK
jgi:cell division transport system permease protein